MTEPPPNGRDEQPAVAALAIQLVQLRRAIESLAHKVDGLASTQRRHSQALADVAQLRSQIEQILNMLDTENEASPAQWFWLTMTDEEREAKFSELYDWVETVLRQQYPDYLADHLKPCWPNHPEARWELAWLYQLWTGTYLGARSVARDAADWHDRWTPGVIGRLSQALTHCQGNCTAFQGTTLPTPGL
jgi:hypothetical protein